MKKEFVISIGNNAFVNDLGQACVSGKEINNALKENSKFIWNQTGDDVTNEINFIQIDDNLFYAFRHIDQFEKIVGLRSDDLEGIEIKDINKTKGGFEYVEKH